MHTYCIEIGEHASITRTFNEHDVKAFSKISGDYNPLHLDKHYAKSTIFKKPVVHGALINALFSSLLGTTLPGEGAIYCHQESKFTRPVYIGETITATVTIESMDIEKERITLTTIAKNQDDVMVLKGKAMVLYPGLKERSITHGASIDSEAQTRTKNTT